MKKYRLDVLLILGIAFSLAFPTMILCSTASLSDSFSALQKRVAAIPVEDSTERVKRATLLLAIERGQNSIDSNRHDEAKVLLTDIRRAIQKPADEFASRNPKASNLSILRPLLTERDNPYLEAMVKHANEELKKPDVIWPRATAKKPTFSGLGKAHGVRDAATQMREYFWLFAHTQSPMQGDPELLTRALRRAHAYSDGFNLYDPDVKGQPEFYDQFALEESLPGLFEIIELHPGLLLPTERQTWDRALKKTAAILWKRMKNAKAWNLNIETARMVGLLNLGYYTKNDEMITKVISHVDTVLARMRPDGGWPYHGEGNPSVNYHNALLGSLLRIYEQTGYEPIAKALRASQWKGPVMGRTDEFWTSPFFKTYRWNFKNGTEAGPEGVAALSGNGYVRTLLDRNIKADRNQVAWYRSDVNPIAMPDQYTIPDHNVGGPRAWYGNFTYAGTFRQTAPKNVAGHKTLMGAMTVDAKDGRLNSVLTEVSPRIQMLPKDGERNSAWAMLTTDLVGATTITRNYSVSTAVHGVGAIHRTAYRGPRAEAWHGRQIWIGLPDRLIGMVSVEAGKGGASAYAVNGVLRLISGGTAGAETTKQLEKLSEGKYRYGQLDILIHDTTYKSLTPVVQKYRLERYPATELTFGSGDVKTEPEARVTSFPAGTDFRFIIEVRPTWITAPITVQMLGDKKLIGLRVAAKGKGFQVWLNASAVDREFTADVDGIPGSKASLTLSDGVLSRSAFASPFESSGKLEPGQHAVIIVSPDPADHQPGWKNFAEMVQDGAGNVAE